MNKKTIYVADETFIGGVFKKRQYVYVKDKHILEVGPLAEIPLVDEDTDLVTGGVLVAGLIDAHCHIGLLEEMDPSGDDVNERGNPIQPYLRAIDGINPQDNLFKEFLACGITTVGIMPGSSNLLAGQGASLYTAGSHMEEMLIDDYMGQKAALGENPKRDYGTQGQAPFTRMGSLALMREAFYQARAYQEKKDQDLDAFDFRLEPLRQLFSARIPLRIHAHRTDDMVSAIRLAEEFGLRLIIEHASGAIRLLPWLSEKKLILAVGPFFMTRSKREMADIDPSLPAKLADHKIDFCLITDAPELPAEGLRLMAMMAHKAGLSRELAMASITSQASKVLGLEKRLGQIKVGLEANLCLFSGDPLDFYSLVREVMVLGVRYDV